MIRIITDERPKVYPGYTVFGDEVVVEGGARVQALSAKFILYSYESWDREFVEKSFRKSHDVPEFVQFVEGATVAQGLSDSATEYRAEWWVLDVE